ncbi:glycosyl hydrolase family 8 [Lentilactobacillus sp. SPB1-3]|uniref:Glycosyl hydrolase family 8 n=1 Tax=Lentilactobacillus terminaliae TaxID=3003483 RepID=A0ACD5DFA3_9LACO|nr:glycosyl hydrolase family 8 [Lentilactobacillus sp. SPB1-3]MCZ0976590.1 glycosyl hydrolase family 8 [Lentilactobacillus sp. SPB1-3]
MKKIIKLLLLCCGCLFITACGSNKQVQVNVPDQQTNKNVLPKYQLRVTKTDVKRSNQLRDFIQNNLLVKKGIYTNLNNHKQSTEYATGHEMLSESSGMWLTYLALSKQNESFHQFLSQTNKTFGQGSQYSYRYDPDADKQADVNATLDDLRILRSMVIYDAVSKTTHYQKVAARKFAELSQNVIKNGQLTNFYDLKLQKGTDNGSLAYFDLKTLKYFESATKKGRKEYQHQLRVLEHGYLGDVFPLYAASYDWKTKQYSQKALNGSEALEVLLHLAEVGKLKKTSLNWLRLQVDQHQLANTYTVTGQIVDKNQSPANYGLAAMVFANVHDQEYYQKAMKIVWQSQVNEPSSKLNGGIGIVKTNEFYSYNNLVSLLASQMGNH